MSRQAAVERTANAFGCAVNGDVHIGLSILDDQGRCALEADLDTATFVHATARTIDIGHAHNDTRHDIPTMIEGVGHAVSHMVAQPLGQSEILGLDLKVHDNPFIGVDGVRIMRSPLIRYKQINEYDMIEKHE